MLNGLHILVVEEEPLIALDMQHVLEDAGAELVTVHRDVIHARQAFDTGLGLAIVEAHLGAEAVIGFCNDLLSRGVPVITTSGGAGIAHLFPGCVMLEKPFDAGTLLAACEMARLVARDAG